MRTRLYVAAVFMGVVGSALFAVLIIQFGGDDPSPPSLQDNPRLEIPGALVFVDKKGCVSVIQASGADRKQVACPVGPGLQEVTWVDEGRVAYRGYDRNADEWIAIDVATGKETLLGPGPDSYQNASLVSAQGERLVVDRSGDIYVARGAETARFFEFHGNADDGLPEFVTWSPDGEWVVLRYWPDEELWIIRRDGSIAGSLGGSLVGGPDGRFSWLIPGAGKVPLRELPAPSR